MNSLMPIVGVVMAGGSGERFWPVSRQLRPKQLLCLADDSQSLLDEAIERLTPLISPQRIFIATNRDLQETIRQGQTLIPAENVLGEPLRRNTSGCLAFVAAHLLARFPGEDPLMSIVTADHLIEKGERFQKTLRAVHQFASEEDALVTIGIHPTRPETGYGYIQIEFESAPRAKCETLPVYPVIRFLEKPDAATAEIFYQSPHYYWNSGMFFWRLSTFLKSLDRVMPMLSAGIRAMADILRECDETDAKLVEVFDSFPNLSIDYGLMEKAENVYVVPGDFTWDDVGSWDSLCRFSMHDGQGNTAVGNPVLIDCDGVTVFNATGADRMAVAVLGMSDTIVVTTDDGVLVCPKNRAQEVRRIVDALKKQGRSQI